VVDAFNVKPNRMKVTNDKRAIKNLSDEGFHDEVIVLIDVRTSEEEAFRWALANADAVEITTQRIRDKIARLADPIYQLYTQTMPDKVRANFDYVLRERTFKISYLVDEDTAYETYEELAKRGKLGVVDNVGVAGEDICELGDYFGDFINAERLYLSTPQLENVSWASRLVNLEKLELKKVHMDDISWIRNLKKLREVQILESTISDLSVLSDHEDIWYLDISGTEIGDISFIQNYQKLDYLNIVACPIKDYSPLLTMQSRLNCLEIDERALELIGEDKIRKRHIGISIIPRPNTPFWRSLI
jgi:Leucine-rich repeat (LRR) protein